MSTNYVDHRGEPRVVITGMGAITAAGKDLATTWDALLTGRSGVDKITRFDASDLPCQIAGEIKEFEPKDYIPYKEIRRMSRASQLAMGAARHAMDNAGYGEHVPQPERTGVIIGTGLGGFDVSTDNLRIFWDKGLRRINTFSLLATLPNMCSHHVSHMAQTLGPINTVATACSTGVQAIGEAVDMIRRGRADVMIAGGVEGIVNDAAIGSFCAMRALATSFNDDPQRASRPFNLDREGFVLSEGVGVVILERLDQALARGATIHAEVLGYASSSDAYHIAVPDPESAGAVRCMRWALEDGRVTTAQIDYVNAHGTSTPMNDVAETRALKQLFGERAYDVPISSTKAVTGHALGGAGAIETIITVTALNQNTIPPTWNYENPDPDCDLDYVPNAPRSADLNIAMCNSFGLGGLNASLVLSKYTNGTTETTEEE